MSLVCYECTSTPALGRLGNPPEKTVSRSTLIYSDELSVIDSSLYNLLRGSPQHLNSVSNFTSRGFGCCRDNVEGRVAIRQDFLGIVHGVPIATLRRHIECSNVPLSVSNLLTGVIRIELKELDLEIRQNQARSCNPDLSHLDPERYLVAYVPRPGSVDVASTPDLVDDGADRNAHYLKLSRSNVRSLERP